MKKIEMAGLYDLCKGLKVTKISSELRTKMLANTILAKKCKAEIEEAQKAAIENATDKEREAEGVVAEARKKVQENKEYQLTEAEQDAVKTISEWNKVFNDAMLAVCNAEVEEKLKKITSDELNQLADGNELTMEQLVFLSENLVA